MTLVKALILPPALQIVFALAGFILLVRYRRSGYFLIAVAFASLYLFSIVPVARALLKGLEIHPPLTDEIRFDDRRAIVVPGGGRYAGAPEYRGDTIGAHTLERLRYAALLSQRSELPVLVSGGPAGPEAVPEAVLMSRVLEQDFAVQTDWTETRSRNTAENAEYSAPVLQRAGIERIVLVTHASHMPRAMWAFEKAGLKVTPAPAAYVSYKLNDQRLPWFVPSMDALNGSYRALYEYFGLWWYRLRY